MPRLVLKGATVIDGTGADPAQADVLMEDGMILEVGPGLDGDEQEDLSGKWLLPGLIDCHVHVMFSGPNLMRHIQTPFSLNFYLAARNLERTLRAGITSVRDAGGADLGVKRAVETGLIPGPDMRIAVTIMSQTGGHADGWYGCGSVIHFFVEHPGRPAPVADGVEGVLRRTREIVRAGADVIKICTTGGVLSPEDEPTSAQYLPEEIDAIVREAASSGLTVMAHAQGSSGIKNALRSGVKSIEHGVYLDDEAIDLLLEKDAFLVPTLTALISILEKPEGIPDAALRKAREIHEIHRRSISRAIDAGVKVAMGTDSGVGEHGRNAEELVQMVEVGMSSMQAIVASTKIAAENIGRAGEVGTIEPGKRADLLAVNDDPIANIKTFSDPRSVHRVWKNGVAV